MATHSSIEGSDVQKTLAKLPPIKGLWGLSETLRAAQVARVTAGPMRPHLAVFPGPYIPLQGRQGSRGCRDIL